MLDSIGSRGTGRSPKGGGLEPLPLVGPQDMLVFEARNVEPHSVHGHRQLAQWGPQRLRLFGHDTKQQPHKALHNRAIVGITPARSSFNLLHPAPASPAVRVLTDELDSTIALQTASLTFDGLSAAAAARVCEEQGTKNEEN